MDRPTATSRARAVARCGSTRSTSARGSRVSATARLADQLADHVEHLGFTHVELLPVAEHPFGGSWGYQVTGYYAPTARFGTPDDFRYFVDIAPPAGHRRDRRLGAGALPEGRLGLARFDGTALYEHADPRLGEHPDWGTLVFNYGRNEVRNFLVANALYWLEEFHIDGLRVDAVASMLYLDYSRAGGRLGPEPLRRPREPRRDRVPPRAERGRRSASFPGVLMIAEESTSWPQVTHPVDHGGLGFTHKWNMGWMHDTLDYFEHDPVHRRWHHRDLTFGLLYAFTERFVLPLSHDEVVHGKGSLLGKMPGDEWQRFANLRALVRLDVGATRARRCCSWAARSRRGRSGTTDAACRGTSSTTRRTAASSTSSPGSTRWPRRGRRCGSATSKPAGFQWLAADDVDESVFSFVRWGGFGRQAVVCVANMTPPSIRADSNHATAASMARTISGLGRSRLMRSFTMPTDSAPLSDASS